MGNIFTFRYVACANQCEGNVKDKAKHRTEDSFWATVWVYERNMNFWREEVVMRCFQSPSASFSHNSWYCTRVKQSRSHSKQAAFMARTFLQRHQLSLFPDTRRSYNLSHELSAVLHHDCSLRHLVQVGSRRHVASTDTGGKVAVAWRWPSRADI
jgi:hypothetical protein